MSKNKTLSADKSATDNISKGFRKRQMSGTHTPLAV